LAEILAIRRRDRVPELAGMPAFSGGLVGYFGFDTIGWIEPRIAFDAKQHRLIPPDDILLLSEAIAVIYYPKGRLYLIVHADPAQPQAYAQACRRLDQLAFRLRHAGSSYPETHDPKPLDESDFVSGFSREGFEGAVRRAQEY